MFGRTFKKNWVWWICFLSATILSLVSIKLYSLVAAIGMGICIVVCLIWDALYGINNISEYLLGEEDNK